MAFNFVIAYRYCLVNYLVISRPVLTILCNNADIFFLFCVEIHLIFDSEIRSLIFDTSCMTQRDICFSISLYNSLNRRSRRTLKLYHKISVKFHYLKTLFNNRDLTRTLIFTLKTRPTSIKNTDSYFRYLKKLTK